VRVGVGVVFPSFTVVGSQALLLLAPLSPVAATLTQLVIVG
jgi:hypothetical protein